MQEVVLIMLPSIISPHKIHTNFDQTSSPIIVFNLFETFVITIPWITYVDLEDPLSETNLKAIHLEVQNEYSPVESL